MTLSFAAFFISAAIAAGANCPVGNLKLCSDFLKTEHAKANDLGFATAYNEICSENPKFSCIKVIVRGDVQEELKEQLKKRGSKASLFPVTLDGETFVFVLAEKPLSK